MGLGIKEKDLELLKKIATRERAPFYVVGEATGDKKLVFAKAGQPKKPVDLKLENLFGSSPKTIITDKTQTQGYAPVQYDAAKLKEYLERVLQLESVACKDWLTNKVDRSVTGKVAMQQTCGQIQLPLNNVAIMALDFLSHHGVATAIGHAPGAALVDPAAGSKLAIAESLTNLVWAPLTHGLKGVSLSANWMWPCKNEGEDARLYRAVEAVSDFAIKLGINVPTGKDSLSMTQKYPDGDVVYAPGTVIISAVGEVSDFRQAISPAIKPIEGSKLIYINLSQDEFKLGGSSFAQVLNLLGDDVPTIKNEAYFAKGFETTQQLISQNLILAGHDISEGGLITALLEMCFAVPDVGLTLNLGLPAKDLVTALFSENPALLIQVENEKDTLALLKANNITYHLLGHVTHERKLSIRFGNDFVDFSIDSLRDVWFKTSFLLDSKQRPQIFAEKRYQNYKHQPLTYNFQKRFDGQFKTYGIDPSRRTPSGVKAAIIREKGVNGDREMAYSLYLAGFDVKDVHMTDLVAGREDLSDVNLIVFVGGFSNSDVLGSAKGWAGAFLYNPKAKQALDNFYYRNDTLSLGVCNGCQLVMELGLLYPQWKDHPKMHHNASGKFESTFINISIPENNSVMLSTFAGARLGVWVAHGEGRFQLPADRAHYQVAGEYSQQEYPGNPNGSDNAIAALCSKDGRHLGIMPHIERSMFTWNWPYYPSNRKSDQISPWIEAFTNALQWIKKHT
jgi:phosphoribosylformylglycinamidine synthase